MTVAPIIEVQHLAKRYDDYVAVEDVTFAVEEDEMFDILGPNGAGKTTTVECLQGLRAADGGKLPVLGHDPGTRRKHSDGASAPNSMPQLWTRGPLQAPKWSWRWSSRR
jgi:ABC-type multidrug transport system ATPase subunit